jgi:LacI family transcriptional regulator
MMAGVNEKPMTLREVARRANVSVATVSYVLAGKGRMAPSTRKYVEGLLREAGLRPRFKRYPVVYLSDHREFRDMQAFNPFLQIYDGMNRAFHEADATLRIEFLHLPGMGPLKDQLNQLLAHRIGAVVIDANLRDEVTEIHKMLEQHEVPVIQVGHTIRAPGLDAAVIDSFGGAYNATRHFIAAGHTKIATIRWNTTADPASAKKFAGFTCALTEANLPIRPEYVIESPLGRRDDIQPGRVAIEQLLALPDPPTAVFVENSFISPSLIYAVNPREGELPAAISNLDIIHFEAWHLEWLEQVLAGKLTFPPRKTKLLRVNWEELGRMAAKRLLERMEGNNGEAQVLQLVPKLYAVEGEMVTPLDES